MLMEMVYFLRRSEDVNLKIASDRCLEFPESPGVQAALAVCKRILGYQARSSQTRVDLIDKVCYCLFGDSERNRGWVRYVISPWIREVNHPPCRSQIPLSEFSTLYKRECVKNYICDYLDIELRDKAEQLYKLISRRG